MDITIDPIDIDNVPAQTAIQPRLSIPGVAALLQKQYSQVTIARYFSVTPQAVNQYIDRHRDKLEPFLDHDAVLAAKMQVVAHEIIDSIDFAAIQRAGLKDRTVAAGVLVDKSRLLSGQSTENVNIQAVTADLSSKVSEAKARVEALREELTGSQTVIDIDNNTEQV